MARVGFLLHPQRKEARELASRAEILLVNLGHEVSYLDSIDKDKKFDLVVSLGGDGTMLRAVDIVSGSETLVMGVNFGRLGYLAEVEPEELLDALEKFFSGNFQVDERMTIRASIVRGASSELSAPVERAMESWLALNEVVLERQSSGHVIRVEVSISGSSFLRYDADGLIVSTPTGSTAYSLSARGPIASPQLEAMILTPISPHMLFDRSLVLSPEEDLDLRLEPGPGASLMVDGMTCAQLMPGDTVRCTRSKFRAKLVSFSKRDFHEILKKKFGLTSKE